MQYYTWYKLTSHYTTNTHTRLTALFPGLPRWAGTRKVKPIWIFLKQEIVSGSGISWAICKSARHSRQITTPAPYHSVFFTGRMPFLPPNQQRQSTEGISDYTIYTKLCKQEAYLSHERPCGIPHQTEILILKNNQQHQKFSSMSQNEVLQIALQLFHTFIFLFSDK